MRTITFLWILCLSLCLTISCGDSNSTETVDDTTTDTTATVVEEPTEEVNKPGPNGELSIEGTLTSFDESGIPELWVAVVKIADNKEYVFNFEASFESANSYMAGVGKNVKVNYKPEYKTSLMDILSEDESIMGEYSPYVQNGNEAGDKWMELTGIINATQVTEGDTPDVFTITSGDGDDWEFEYFVTPEMVALDGQEITAYYEDRVTNVAKTIELGQ
jgi:hypothetical protein